MRITKTKSEAGILVLIVFVLGILVGGLGNHVWGQRVWGARNARPPHVDIVTNFAQRLNLTAAQQQQVQAITEDTSKQWHELYAPVDRKRDEIRAQSRAQLRAVMTPEQLPKFDEFVHELDAQHQQRPGR